MGGRGSSLVRSTADVRGGPPLFGKQRHPLAALVSDIVGSRISFATTRIILAVLLFTAGALKAGSLLFNGFEAAEAISWRTQTVALVGSDVLIGAWLLAGYADLATWWGLIALFSALSGVSTRRMFLGAASCGCFGAVSVRPVFAFLLDAAILIWLVFLAIRGRAQTPSDPLPAPFASYPARAACTVLVLVAVSACVGFGVGGRLASRDEANGLLDPESWVGKSLPEQIRIETAADLSRGAWVVVFYDSDCPKCRRLIEQIGGGGSRLVPQRSHVALIAVPPSRTAIALPAGNGFHHGRVADGGEALIHSPLIVYLDENKVTSVWSG